MSRRRQASNTVPQKRRRSRSRNIRRQQSQSVGLDILEPANTDSPSEVEEKAALVSVVEVVDETEAVEETEDTVVEETLVDSDPVSEETVVEEIADTTVVENEAVVEEADIAIDETTVVEDEAVVEDSTTDEYMIPVLPVSEENDPIVVAEEFHVDENPVVDTVEEASVVDSPSVVVSEPNTIVYNVRPKAFLFALLSTLWAVGAGVLALVANQMYTSGRLLDVSYEVIAVFAQWSFVMLSLTALVGWVRAIVSRKKSNKPL